MIVKIDNSYKSIIVIYVNIAFNKSKGIIKLINENISKIIIFFNFNNVPIPQKFKKYNKYISNGN